MAAGKTTNHTERQHLPINTTSLHSLPHAGPRPTAINVVLPRLSNFYHNQFVGESLQRYTNGANAVSRLEMNFQVHVIVFDRQNAQL